jgi:hypothetical protein
MIVKSCTLELIALKRGSTTLEFDFADPQFRLPDHRTLGADAVHELATNIKILGNGASRKTKQKIVGEMNEGVLHGISGLTRMAKAHGFTQLRFVSPKSAKTPAVNAPVNDSVMRTVSVRLSRPRRAAVTVDGYLEMADFKPRDYKCRIEPAIGTAINCTFNPELADMVTSLMRRPVRVTGEGVFPPNSDRIETIAIKSIEPLPSLAVGEGNFFSARSLDELAKLQGICGPTPLGAGFPSDEDVDAFLKEIYESRK